eukprot:SAG31_NODE_175_length_21352_cov_3.981508_19_plen_186_part_00
MRFTLDSTNIVPGRMRHIPQGTGDRSNCISAHEDMIASPFNVTLIARNDVGGTRPVSTSAMARSSTGGGYSESVGVPVVFRVCTNVTTKGNNRHPSTTHCFNSTKYPTDGGLQPLTLIGANFSASGVNGTVNPTCRIDPFHGGTINVHKGEDPNAYDISENHVTFPAKIINDSYAICEPPPKVSL